MKYQCNFCKRPFIHTAEIIEMNPTGLNEDLTKKLLPNAAQVTTQVCPFCLNKDYTEFVEPVVSEQKTVGVLVIDLVPGDNIALNKALADGYEIVGRYAKAYTLEKKQPIKTEAKT